MLKKRYVFGETLSYGCKVSFTFCLSNEFGRSFKMVLLRKQKTNSLLLYFKVLHVGIAKWSLHAHLVSQEFLLMAEVYI